MYNVYNMYIIRLQYIIFYKIYKNTKYIKFENYKI